MPLARNRMVRWIALALALCLVSPASAIRIGEEDRKTFETFDTDNGLTKHQMRTMFGATLRIICARGGGTGAVVSETGVFLTAEHVLYDPHADGDPLRLCRAQSLFGKTIYRIDRVNYFRGSEFRHEATGEFEKDIFIGRLVADEIDIEPFKIELVELAPGDWVYAVAQGQENWRADGDIKRPSIGLCGVLETTSLSALTDCDADGGSSGGPLLRFPFRRGAVSTLVGITVSVDFGPSKREAAKDCEDTLKCSTQHLIIDQEVLAKINELSLR